MMMQPVLYFIIPCYNDAQTLCVTAPVFLRKLSELTAAGVVHADSRILLIDDGSADGTWDKIVSLHASDARFCGLRLAVNTGEQNAILAGMQTALDKADCMISMDSDLQDDIQTVDQMLRLYAEGNAIVCGVRSARSDDPLFERLTSSVFYTVMERLHTGLIREHANYRLMRRDAAVCLLEQAHGDFYLPCLACTLDFPSAAASYERTARAAGRTGYTFPKRLKLALHAIRSHGRLSTRGTRRPSEDAADAALSFPICDVLF